MDDEQKEILAGVLADVKAKWSEGIQDDDKTLKLKTLYKCLVLILDSQWENPDDNDLCLMERACREYISRIEKSSQIEIKAV